MPDLPHKQRAVQLVGPDKLLVNSEKPVVPPGPHQVLAKVEVVGLCFSDLKLLKQFSKHARKSEVCDGLDAQVLSQMPNYVPGDRPTVPGHETVLRIVDTGRDVVRHKPGERYLVQTDYRWLPTPASNAAFGYNFEGGLQEYVLLDERVIISPAGESMLIPVPEDLAGSALALVEPWACVENSYVEKQRHTPKAGGRLLVIGDHPVDKSQLGAFTGTPSSTTFAKAGHALGSEPFDDIVYFGAKPEVLETLFPLLAAGGLMIIVQGGAKFGRPVVSPVGRIHYGGIRMIGTPGGNLADAVAAIPATSEVRAGAKINVVGAAGPMGLMHIVRLLSSDIPNLQVFAGDLNDERLAHLRDLAEPLAHKSRKILTVYNPSREESPAMADYSVLMAPVPALIPSAIAGSAPHGIINIFAGIPAEVAAPLDLDAYIAKQLYFIGTSGSTLEDMKSVLAKVVSRQLDTNLLVAAVSGLDGAIDGIRAVEKNQMLGKIVVYPSCRGLALQRLENFADNLPLENGRWNKQAEEALLKTYGAS